MKTIGNVGSAAREQVNTAFGSWATGPELVAGKNLTDRFETDKAEQAKGSPDDRHHDALHRARYLLDTDSDQKFGTIDTEHSADRNRAAERKILEDLLARVTTAHEEQLLLITATWSAATDAKGNIRIQRFSTGDEQGDRNVLWDKFGTLCHEYCHSLAHPAWRQFRNAKAKVDPQGADTITEGVTELLTRIALSLANPSDKHLRQQVEGNLFQEDGELPDLDRDAYESELARAQELVGVVGIHNLFAAYFLGQTQLVGA